MLTWQRLDQAAPVEVMIHAPVGDATVQGRVVASIPLGGRNPFAYMNEVEFANADARQKEIESDSLRRVAMRYVVPVVTMAHRTVRRGRWSSPEGLSTDGAIPIPLAIEPRLPNMAVQKAVALSMSNRGFGATLEYPCPVGNVVQVTLSTPLGPIITQAEVRDVQSIRIGSDIVYQHAFRWRDALPLRQLMAKRKRWASQVDRALSHLRRRRLPRARIAFLQLAACLLGILTVLTFATVKQDDIELASVAGRSLDAAEIAKVEGALERLANLPDASTDRLLRIYTAATAIGDHAHAANAAQGLANRIKTNRATWMLTSARHLMQKGDYRAADAAFDEMLGEQLGRELPPEERAEIYVEAARAAIAMKQLNKAVACFLNASNLTATDPEQARELLGTLIAAGQTKLAIQVLDQMDRSDQVLREIVNVHEMAKQPELAVPELEELERRHPDDMRVVRRLAELAVLRRDYAAGLDYYRALWKAEPNDANVLAISVRYALLIGDNDLAVRQAAKLDELYPGNIDLRLELASALYAARRYAEAGRLFAEVVGKSPTNEVALLGCARVALRDYRVDRADSFLDEVPVDIRGRQWHLVIVERDTIMGNYLRAHKILNRLLQENPDDNRASMALADLDRAKNGFIKADARYLAAGATANNAAAGQHFAVSLYFQCRYVETERVCRHVLQIDPTDTRTMIVLARVLVKTNRCEEAMSLIRQAQEADGSLSPEGIYYARFISPEFGVYAAEDGDLRPIYIAAALFDLAMEDGRRAWAKTVLDDALRLNPENIVLRTRLAEWYASFGLPLQASCAARIYEELLAGEPSNQKWILGLARATATMRWYHRSLALYRRLRCESPDDYLVARETAEVFFHVCGTPKGLAEYDSALCGWPGLDEEANRLCKERLAKSAHYSSPSIAAGAYGELLAAEPYEQHIAFELGQVNGILGTTHGAIDAYSHLLSVNPNHRDAQVAIEGKWLALRPQAFADHRFERERGRDGLTSIDRLGEFVGYKMPFADQNEWFSVGYGRLSLAPEGGNATTGDAVTFTVQKQIEADFGPRLSPYAPMAVFVDAEVQRYDRYVATRPVFEAGVKIRTCDDLLWTISGTMENVLENSESLQQDIYRGGLRADLKFMPNNYLESEATYELQGYSDNNLRQAGELRNRLQLTPEPRRFSLLADFYYWNFAYPSEFSPGPDPFLNMTHPYWTPINYAMSGVGVEWKQWLSWDRFDGADHCWVSFSYMKRYDSQYQNYNVYCGKLVWDITRRLSGYATGEYTDGAPYRGTGAYGGFTWKF